MFATGRRRLRHLTEIRRRYGIFAAFQLLADRLANLIVQLEVVNILWLPGQHLRVPGGCDPQFRFRFLTADDVRVFAADPSNDLSVEFSKRINTGHDLCFGGLLEGRLLAYSWFALESIEAAHACNIAMSYPKHMAYWYKVFTHPDFRGKGLLGVTVGLALQELGDQGVRELVAFVNWTNFPMLHGCHRIGCILLGRMVLVRIWGRQLAIVPRRAKLLGLRFGSKAMVRQSNLQ